MTMTVEGVLTTSMLKIMTTEITIIKLPTKVVNRLNVNNYLLNDT